VVIEEIRYIDIQTDAADAPNILQYFNDLLYNAVSLKKKRSKYGGSLKKATFINKLFSQNNHIIISKLEFLI